MSISGKTSKGHFFEDFYVGQVLRHGTPRTITDGDTALYTALYGSRFAVQSADSFANAVGYPQAPIDDLLVFHMVFGKTVPDVSLNAVANLGYAEGRFLLPLYPGDTVVAVSEVIGVKQNSNGKTGIVYVRTVGYRQDGEKALEYVRWVMVPKRDPQATCGPDHVPPLDTVVAVEELGDAVPHIHQSGWDEAQSGSRFRYDHYEIGEKIDHVDGMTVEEAEHQLATRLFQNTAKVHFNQHLAQNTPHGRRLIYGGHVMSLARSLSFNGLSNAFHVAAINGGRHVAPLFAGDTVYAWSEVLDKRELLERDDVGALRLRTVATKDRPCHDFPWKSDAGDYEAGVLLDLDYWVVLPH
ncbi:MaoC family dehydratase [Pseudovibrio exalbescens]|uniref:MaoC family dehydratase n=1 Tax=Pseudovibrio exalbescens TaxID=197461 RepID=UPI0023663950|nr:MaoC family dehydratase [Pseudovibrio exalbescens]MDD7911736.1 MaoC family dehydratase [Pseudovibrio exalbescens]